MKFKVAMSDLQAALQVVKPAMSGDASDMMGHFLFRKSQTDGRVDVLTHERYTQAMTSFVAEIESGDDAFTTNGGVLQVWLSSIAATTPDSLVVFEHKAEEKKTYVYPSVRPTRKHPFGSLDPTTYPSYDTKLKRAKVTSTVKAGRLLGAMESSKGFISGDEQMGPDTMIAEIKDGLLKATTLKTLAIVKMPGLEDANIRFHVTQHVPPVISYLQACQAEDDMEILEADEIKGQSAGMYFLRRSDGTIFGWNQYTREFPPLAMPKAEDDIWWQIDPKEMGNAVTGVLAAARKESPLVRFSRPHSDGPMYLEAVGEEGDVQWDIDISASGTGPNADDIKMPDSFRVTRASLEALLKAVRDTPITFGMSYKAKANSGYVRVVEARGIDNDEFLFMLAWWRDLA